MHLKIKDNIKNSAKRDTRPLKGCDLTHKSSLRGNPKRSLRRKILSVQKKYLDGSNLFKGSGLSVALKPECGITKLSSRIAFNTLLNSSCSLSSSPFRTISLGALVGLQEKVGKASKQAIKIFDSMTTAAQRAAVVKTLRFIVMKVLRSFFVKNLF